MKSQLQRKAIVTALAALCVWSSQASAIDGRDGIFNCRVFSLDPVGTEYWLSAQNGTLQYTTHAAQATIFTFTRQDTWKHDTGGTAYYMTASPVGGCLGVKSDVNIIIGTPVVTNWTCTPDSSKRIVIESRNSSAFVMRVEKKDGYWFDGWGGLAQGNQIKLNTPQNGGNFGPNQIFYTNGCRTSTNKNARPKAGTN